MSKKNWIEVVKEYAQLQIGENTFEITGEPTVQDGEYGERLHIPTNLGVWRIGCNSLVARKLKKIAEETGSVSHVALTIVKTGEKKDTRYDIKKVVLPSQRRHEPPPRNQTMINLEDLSDEQKQQLQQILKSKEESTRASI